MRMAHGRLEKNTKMRQRGLEIFIKLIHDKHFLNFQRLKMYRKHPSDFFEGVIFLFCWIRDFFLHPILSAFECGELVSRLGFCSMCPNYSLPSTLHAFPGVCFFQSRILPCSFVCACCCIILFVCFQDCLKPHTLYFIILSSSFTACH